LVLLRVLAVSLTMRAVLGKRVHVVGLGGGGKEGADSLLLEGILALNKPLMQPIRMLDARYGVGHLHASV
jgi:hypothetical protein